MTFRTRRELARAEKPPLLFVQSMQIPLNEVTSRVRFPRTRIQPSNPITYLEVMSWIFHSLSPWSHRRIVNNHPSPMLTSPRKTPGYDGKCCNMESMKWAPLSRNWRWMKRVATFLLMMMTTLTRTPRKRTNLAGPTPCCRKSITSKCGIWKQN